MVQVIPRNSRKRSTAATLTTVSAVYYTCPVGYLTQITRIIISNGSNSTQTATLRWYHKEDDTTYTIINAVTLAGNSATNFDFDLHMGSEDRLEAFTAAGTAVTILFSYHEEYVGT
jgi:hypothetical protein